jgi:hypothetical protein
MRLRFWVQSCVLWKRSRSAYVTSAALEPTFSTTTQSMRRWGSSVSIVNGVRPPAEVKGFSSRICVQTNSESHPAFYLMDTRCPFPWVKRGRSVTLTTHPPYNAEVRMSQSYTSSPYCLLHGCSFTFTLTKSTCILDETGSDDWVVTDLNCIVAVSR